ncbi:MAG: HD domain-containing protein [Chloroflexi bacterium]|nr:HD domain-containing protein [Chloroflexota bacterium]MDA1003868.1 HD domain-containing protein [Chloroflexota bacterium]
MTTAVHPALAPFLAARADTSPRPLVAAGALACEALTETLDEALRQLAAESDPALAIVAVGGYGRREQCRHSDIDVMLLVEPDGDDAAKRLLYPVWDTGVKVGHSIRTLAHVNEAGRQNVETLTALFDARFVAGNRDLYDRFVRTRATLTRRRASRLRAELAERHDQLLAHEPWQVQSANLKTGRGGLRDLQLVHWLEFAEATSARRDPLPLSPALVDARERLLATRNAVHALSERALDVYRDDLVPRVAEWLGVEVASWSRGLYLAMREVDAAATARLDQPGTPQRRWLAWPRPRSERGRPGRSGERDLDLLLTALHRMEPDAGAPPLDPLPKSEWLERLLPEWEVLRGRRHIAPFHTHPVDVHAMRTVAEAIHALTTDEDRTGTPQVAAELNHDELLLAALLHDIGKGHEASHVEGGAVIAERFASRAALSAERAARLVRAVELHLLLPTVATRRDIADARVIRETGELVGDAQTLRLLYLLSVADARATGPSVWNAWKAQLLRSLYTRVLDTLGAAAPDAATSPEDRLQLVIDGLAPRFGAAEVEAHVSQIAAGYLLSNTPETIDHHLELIREARQAPLGTAVRRDALGELDRLTIVTQDRPGILQTVAGTLASHNASVLGGVAYTREDGMAIEIWHVRDALAHGIDERRWTRILDAIPRALAGDFPIDERVAEVRATYGAAAGRPAAVAHALATTVHIDNSASDQYSVLEVATADRLGLLYGITRALHALAIDIHLAKVNTIGSEVVDAFYIRRENGRRIDSPDEIERVEQRVREAIEAIEAIDRAPPPPSTASPG